MKKLAFLFALLLVGVASAAPSVVSTTETSATVEGLDCGSKYRFEIRKYTAGGGLSSTADYVDAQTKSCADTQPPTVPQDFAATGVTQTSVSVSWSASTDDVGVAGYHVYRGGVKVDSTSATSYTFGGLSCGTSHTLAVEAYDAAGHVSAASAIAASTTACPPTSCPTGQYLSKYYGNMTLAGTPVLQRCETTINHDWASGSPAADVPANQFSTRWTGTFFLAAGTYNFTATADDGIRVWVDGTSLIDVWKDQSPTTYQATRSLTAGDHTVMVEYYENGGLAVAKVSWQLSQLPPPPTPDTAALAVSTSGSDATCARSDLTKPCATFKRAYALASPGDTVLVRGGTYGPQDLDFDASNAVAPGVTFREAAGEKAVATGTGSDSALEMGRDGPGSAQHVTLDGIDFDQVYIRYTGSPAVVPEGITIRNAHLGTKRETGLFSGSVRNFRLENVEFGPTCCNEDAAQIAQGGTSDPSPNGVALVNVNFHDVRSNCADIPAAAWANCASESKPYSGNHVDCVQSTGWRNVAIRSSRFVNCQTGLQMGAEKGRNWNMLIENSMFSGHHWVNFTCGGPCNGDYAWVSPDSSGAQTYVKLYYNTFAATGNPGLRAQQFDPDAQLELVGNIIHGTQSCTIRNDLGTTVTWDVHRYNMSQAGGVCGPGDFNGVAQYVQPTQDLHLRVGSPGKDAAEAAPCRLSSDIDAQVRPIGAACDVGADEFTSAGP